MLRINRIVLAGLGALWFLSSCSVERLDEPIIIPLVDQEFRLDLWENLGTSTLSDLEIRMTTIEEEDCLNTLILSDYERTGRNLSITLYDILDPEVCDPGSAPATGIQRIIDVEAAVYNIEIELQDIVNNSGTLTITDDAYRITMTDEAGISWNHKTLLRVPENVLWGYVAFTNAAEEARVATLMEELRALGASLQLPEGYYGYFTVNNGGNSFKITDAPEAETAKFLFLNYSDEPNLVEEKINEFLASAGNENTELRLLDSKGNVWEN